MTKSDALEAIARNGGVTLVDALKVLDYYRKVKAVKYNAHDGFRFIHGLLLNQAVIRDVVAAVSNGEG